MGRGEVKKWGSASAILGVLLIAPAAAPAAVNCSVAGSTLQVDITAGSFGAFIERGTGPASGDILVYDGFTNAGAQSNCGTTPTVTTIDTVNVDELAMAQGSSAVFSLVNGPFAPGLTDEGDGSSEIEIDYDTNADDAGTDQFNVNGGGGVENVRFGSAGGSTSLVNLNGAESSGVDADATIDGVDRSFAELGGGDDVHTGDGTATPGAATPTPIEFSVDGGAGDDTLRTGSAANGNRIDGGVDDDTIVGGAGSDSLGPEGGNDTVDGGAGPSDILSYLNDTGPVTIDLGVTTPQDTGGMGTDTIVNLEGFVGSNGVDRATGTNGPNALTGGQLSNDTGADVLLGLGGPDTLNGGPGDDTLNPGPGDDSVIGWSGAQDTISYTTADAPGIALTLDPGQTGVPQVTGGSGTDTLDDDFIAPGTHHGIENVVGSPFGDTLTGNDDPNQIAGGAGSDTISLGGDADTFLAWDGILDTVNCGAGADSGQADELTPSPVDTLNADCETVDYAPQTTLPSGPADGSSTTDTTPLYTLGSDEPATFTFSVDGGAPVACAASCEITPALSVGPHQIVFRAADVDENQNFDLTPVTRSLTITSPPTTPQQPATPAQPATPKKCKKGRKLKKGKCVRKKKRKK